MRFGDRGTLNRSSAGLAGFSFSSELRRVSSRVVDRRSILSTAKNFALGRAFAATGGRGRA